MTDTETESIRMNDISQSCFHRPVISQPILDPLLITSTWVGCCSVHSALEKGSCCFCLSIQRCVCCLGCLQGHLRPVVRLVQATASPPTHVPAPARPPRSTPT